MRDYGSRSFDDLKTYPASHITVIFWFIAVRFSEVVFCMFSEISISYLIL